MQSTILSLSSHGVPLCVSPISARFPFSKQIADHDRRRESVKRRMRMRSQSAGTQGNVRSRRTRNGVVAEIRVSSAEDLSLNFGFLVLDDDDDDDVSCNAAKAA